MSFKESKYSIIMQSIIKPIWNLYTFLYAQYFHKNFIISDMFILYRFSMNNSNNTWKLSASYEYYDK